ncbi:MAG: response regulator [Deltaproteobacteria bacterium]|nr:response regulator [Deltaproteobacteria bacterium]
MDTILLIAEEDQRIKNIVRFTFEQMDYKVVSTSSGVDAVLKTTEIKPDLVLVDVSLPDKNGYEVAREIKNNPILQNTPVILLISSFVTFNKTKVTESLADDFIIKPFEFDEIIKKVKSLTIPSKNKIKPPIILNRERKETFAKVMLALFVISLLTTPILYLNSRSNPPRIEPNSKQAYEQVKNDSGSDKLLLVKSNAVSISEGQKITITLNKNGKIFINDTKYAFSELNFEISKLIASLGKQIEEQVVLIKADPSVPYGNVIEVSAEIKKVGIKKIELDTEPLFLTESEQLGDRETSKEDDSKSSQNKELQVPRQLPKIEVVKEERPKVTYTMVSHTDKENGKKVTDGLKLAEASRTSVLKETEKKQTASKQIEHKVTGETKKKVEEKKGPKEDQIKTSRTAGIEASDKLKKAEAKKETPKQKTSIKNEIEIKGNKYIVKKGETLWRISKKFNTSVQNLMVANKLKDNKIQYGKVLIVPSLKEQPQNKTEALERKKNNNFLNDIKITDWSLYVAWGMPTLHNVTIENTSNTSYSDIKIKVLYYYSYSTDSAKLETGEVEGTLPVTVPAYSKKTYLQKGITLKQGSASSMFAGAKEINIIGATPIKKVNVYSLK